MLLEHFLYFLGCGDIDNADTVIIHVDLLMSAFILAVWSVDYDFGNEFVDKFGSKLLDLGYLFNLGNKLSKIVVHAPYRKDKRRHQQIDVYYHGVGIVYIPTAEELEEMFEEHLEDIKWEREQEVNIKEKTA